MGKVKSYMMDGLEVNHGSPADRGSADAYYWRESDPHWWPEGTGKGIRIEQCDMLQSQIDIYMESYNNETERKDHG